MTATLFDLTPYHVEPKSDPNRPTAIQALRLIDKAEADRDLEWLQHFQHFIFVRGGKIWGEDGYSDVFYARRDAERRVASALEPAS